MSRLNSTIALFLLVLGISCSRAKKSGGAKSTKDAKIFCENTNKDNFASFTNWAVYRRNETKAGAIVCDYTGGESTSRFLIKYEKSFLIKSIGPHNDSAFTPLRNYPEELLNSLGINKKHFELNLELYRKLKADKILYRKEFDGLVISTDKFTVIKILSDRLMNKIPKNYILLSNNCYHYSE